MAKHDLTASPTVAGAPNLTQEGTILGTFQYMAPEQLEGGEADARSDILAFGAVLYEMATGRKAFEGKSQASLISAIMKEEPAPISSVQKMTPPALDRVVKTCLAKDPEDRWQSAHDIGSELQWIAQSGSQAGVAAPAAARRRNRERLAWSVAAVLLVVATAAIAGYVRRAPGSARPIRSSILLPEKHFLASVAISPDGGQLAFVAAAADGRSLLWVRSLDGLSARPLPGTENALLPFWSPDGRSIGFFADAKLKRIDAAGGPAVVVCDAAPNGWGGTWGREGVILFSHPGAPISRVPASGGAPAPVTRIDAARHETTHRYPWFLPDGRHFLYMAANLSGVPDDPANLIHLASIESTEDRPLIPAYSNTVYANGHLLFERDGSLFARRFDEKRLQATGDLLPIAEQILLGGRFWRYAVFCASESGMVVYGTSPAAPSELLWLDRAGRQTGTVGEPAFYRTPRVSPDGRRLAVTILDPSTRKSDVWLYEFTRGVRTRFTSGSSNNDVPIWSPDGGSIVFRTDRKHQGDLYRKVIGGGGEEPLLEGEGQRTPDDVSPDGRFVALELREPKGGRQVSLSILPLFGDRQPKTFFQRGMDSDDARFSPAGRWLAYTSQESGKSEVYVASFPGPGAKWQVSTAGGFGPAWRRDGKELYYLSADFKLMAVAIRASAATFEPAAPQALFDLHRIAIGYDAAADGQRFLIVSAGIEQSPPITLIQNWPAGLKKEARSAN